MLIGARRLAIGLVALGSLALGSSARGQGDGIPRAPESAQVGGASKAAAKTPNSFAVSKGRRIKFINPDTGAVFSELKLSHVVRDLRQVGDVVVALTKCSIVVIDATNPSAPREVLRQDVPNCSGLRFSVQPCDPPVDGCQGEIFVVEEGTGVSRWRIETAGEPSIVRVTTSNHQAALDNVFVAPFTSVLSTGPNLELLDWTTAPPSTLDTFAPASAHFFAEFTAVGDDVVYPLPSTVGAVDTSMDMFMALPNLPVGAGVTRVEGQSDPARLFFGDGFGFVVAHHYPLADPPVAIGVTQVLGAVERLQVYGNDLFIMSTFGAHHAQVQERTGITEPLAFPGAPSTDGVRLLAASPQCIATATGHGIVCYSLNPFEAEILGTYASEPIERIAESGEGGGRFFASGPLGVYHFEFGASGLELLDKYALPFAGDFDTAGTRVYASGGSPTGLAIVDFATRGNPQLVSQTNVGGSAYDVLALGLTLYVAAGDVGVQIYDITNPSSPAFIRTVLPPTFEGETNFVTDIVIGGDNMAFACGNNGVHLYDYADVHNPAHRSGIPGATHRVLLNSNLLYAANGDVRIFDVTDPTVPQIVAMAETGSDAVGGFTLVTTQNFIVHAGDAGSLHFTLPPLIKQVLDAVLRRSETAYYSEKNKDGVSDSADIVWVIAGR